MVSYLAWVLLGVVLPLFWLLRVRDPKSNKSISTGVSETIIVSCPFPLSAVLGPLGTFSLGAMFQVNFANLASGLSVLCSW
jgi:hypothetical protein